MAPLPIKNVGAEVLQTTINIQQQTFYMQMNTLLMLIKNYYGEVV
jgi:hypothetical protein